MKTNLEVPAWVDGLKVLDWEGQTPLREGIISIEVLKQEASKYCNWLVFYCWCYARTQGFTNKCMKNWDFGNFGGNFKTSRDGVKDALSEFIKFEDTALLEEQAEVEKLYAEIEAFCRGVIYTEPKPLPKPEPEPIPVPPQPEKPKPDTEPSPSEPSQPGAPSDWKKWLKILGPILAGVLTLGGLFLPGWAKVVLDILVKLINGIAG
jgi:hypothetical protein